MWYYSWHTISTTEVQQNWSFLDLPVNALTAPLVLQQLQLQPAGSTSPAYLHSSQSYRTSEKFQMQRSCMKYITICAQFQSLIKTQHTDTICLDRRSISQNTPPTQSLSLQHVWHHIWRQSCKHLGITLEKIIIIQVLFQKIPLDIVWTNILADGGDLNHNNWDWRIVTKNDALVWLLAS